MRWKQVEMAGRIGVNKQRAEQGFVAKGAVYRVCRPGCAEHSCTDDSEPVQRDGPFIVWSAKKQR